jgi:hypothetical protein
MNILQHGIDIPLINGTVSLTPGHVALLLFNISLYFLASPIVRRLNFEPKKVQTKIWTFRFFNFMFLILHVLDFILQDLKIQYGKQLSLIAQCLISIYTIRLIHHVCSHFVKMKFGSQKDIDGKEVSIENYSSRVVHLLMTLFLAFINLIIVIQILGFNSLLETTGLIGIVIGFFALTSSIWAPDIFHGLVLLNSKMITDGDLVEIDGDAYIVFKTSLMETVLLNIVNNHRTRVRNSYLGTSKIDNLTRLADAQGIRETILYKVSYPQNEKDLEDHDKRIQQMFRDAFESCTAHTDIQINENSKPEVLLTEAGDHALHYSFSFYLQKISRTKVTKEARAFLRTKYLVNESVFKASVKNGIDLSTPTQVKLIKEGAA